MLSNPDDNQLDAKNFMSKIPFVFPCDTLIEDISVSDDHQLIAIATKFFLSDPSYLLDQIIVSIFLNCNTFFDLLKHYFYTF